MSVPPFLRADSLDALGIDHGLGTLRSGSAEVASLATCRQVHGTTVVRAPLAAPSEADALLALDPDLAVGVYTADCVPLLLAAADGSGVAAVHAGWRGSAARMAEVAVAELCRVIERDPAQLVAVIGPCIGPCCYEIDEPVRAQIDDEAVFRDGERPRHWYLDLALLNQRQLQRAGIQADRIERVGGCTACDPERYASYRRDGTSARMLHYVRCL